MPPIPIVSIVIPVYNTARYLQQCLDSVLNQTFTNFEVICVNDKSTDNSKEILEEYQKKDSRIKVVEHEVNQGLGPSRNTGISVAQGKYIMFIDSDDYIHPQAIELCYTAIEKENADIIQCMTQRVSDYSLLRANPFPKIKGYEVFSNNLYRLLQNSSKYRMNISAWAKLFKTEHFRNVKFPNLISEDIVPPYTILLTKAKRVVFLPYIIYFYRKNLNGISRRSSLEHSCNVIADHFTNYKLFLTLKTSVKPNVYKVICQECYDIFSGILKWNLDELDEKTRILFLENYLPPILKKARKSFSREVWNNFLSILGDYYKYKNIPGFDNILHEFSYKPSLTMYLNKLLDKITPKFRGFIRIWRKLTDLRLTKVKPIELESTEVELVAGKVIKVLILHTTHVAALKYVEELLNTYKIKYKVINPTKINIHTYPLHNYNAIIDCSTFSSISRHTQQKYILVYIPILDHNIKVDNKIPYDAILTLNLVDKKYLKNNFVIKDEYIFSIDKKLVIKNYDRFLMKQALLFVQEKIKYLLIISNADIYQQIDYEKIDGLLNDNEVLLIHDANKLSGNNFFSPRIVNVSSFNQNILSTCSQVTVVDNLTNALEITSVAKKVLFISDHKKETDNILTIATHYITKTDKEEHLLQAIRETMAIKLYPNAIDYIKGNNK